MELTKIHDIHVVLSGGFLELTYVSLENYCSMSQLVDRTMCRIQFVLVKPGAKGHI